MDWPHLGQWEWAIGEVVILPLLFFELYRVRRSQRRDRESERNSTSVADAEGAGHPEGQHRLDPCGPKSVE
jgi:hypothetical protein